MREGGQEGGRVGGLRTLMQFMALETWGTSWPPISSTPKGKLYLCIQYSKGVGVGVGVGRWP